ncbi:GntR family transcriptional regulator [uncultured Serinicoccus sp.]|uniref:GntR family transcriptional regulator n=1 Tax=uncultured Serinicoccus sp. TaxID=735514 RepID=UPI00262DF684|nr:GntR family transcriptional regulator [uncultured Serinicoccus sp.]
MAEPTETVPPAAGGAASASDRAYAWIRSAILEGSFAEGDFLDEVALSAAVGTSRTPVREALRRLHAERFIDIAPRRGAQVRTITADEMREVYEARLLIETHAVQGICDRRAGAPPEALELLDQMEQAGRERAWNRSAQLDQAFHLALVRQHGNTVLTHMYDALRSRQVHVGARTISTAPERFPLIQSEHRNIVRALDEHDAETAITTLRAHLRAVPELVRAFSH